VLRRELRSRSSAVFFFDASRRRRQWKAFVSSRIGPTDASHPGDHLYDLIRVLFRTLPTPVLQDGSPTALACVRS